MALKGRRLLRSPIQHVNCFHLFYIYRKFTGWVVYICSSPARVSAGPPTSDIPGFASTSRVSSHLNQTVRLTSNIDET